MSSEVDNISNDISKDLHFDMYLYSIASQRNKYSLMKFMYFIASKNEQSFKRLHTVSGIIERYRAWKTKPEYEQSDGSINFDKMAQVISSDLKQSSIVLDQEKDDVSLPVTIPMEIFEIDFIKYIITKIAEWENTGDPFMQDEQDDPENTLLE